MKWLIYALVALAASVVVGLVALPDPGYVLLGYGKYSVETTLLTLLAGLFLIYILLRVLSRIWKAPRNLQAWNSRQQLQRDRKRLNNGLVELVEGNSLRAEQDLKRLVKQGDKPLITYLAAARAAQQQGAIDRRDYYLQQAHDALPEAGLAIELSRAELQIAQGDYASALATLGQLRKKHPHHSQVLKLLMSAYQQTGDWQRLRELLPDLKRRKVLDEQAYQATAVHLYRELMQQALRERDLAALQQVWADTPRPLQQESSLVAVYVDDLLQLGADEEAETVIRNAMKNNWNPQLATLYGQLRGGDAARQLAIAEDWLKQHADDDRLLLTAARLSMRNELWGKAKSYLEASIGRNPAPESYQLLGMLCEKTNDGEQALAAYRKGVKLVSASTTGRALPDMTTATLKEGQAGQES